MKLTPIRVVAIAGMVLLGAGASLAQQAPFAPKDETPEMYPAGPHRDDAFYFCTACHSFQIVAAQGMNRERWDESLTWMVQRHNMPKVEGKDREKILDYLSAAFPERRQPTGWKNPFAPQ
jgi:hypothetical protein